MKEKILKTLAISFSVIALVIFVLCLFAGLFSGKLKNEEKSTVNPLSDRLEPESEIVKPEIIASTSWTAAFCDLAGADRIEIVAPCSMKHPPEYEITVSDIKKIEESPYFVYAGFERMMETLSGALEGPQMIQIQCTNAVSVVSSQAMKIASFLGTEDVCEERVMEYINVINEGKIALEKKYPEGASVFCNKNQLPLAKELGFKIAGVFGPGEITSDNMLFVKKNKIDFIIDNIHNPVGRGLTELSSSKYVVWRNFPESVKRAALCQMVQENIDSLGL